MSADQQPQKFETIEPADFKSSAKPSGSDLPGPTAAKSPARYFGLLILLLGLSYIVWFFFKVERIQLLVTPEDADFTIDAIPHLALGYTVLIQKGTYPIILSAEGYQDLNFQLEVLNGASVSFELEKLPGQVTLSSTPQNALVQLPSGEIEFGHTPLIAKVPAGQQTLLFTLPRYQPQTLELEIIGLNQPQSAPNVAFKPDWAEVEISSNPPQAQVWINQENHGATPGSFEILSGLAELKVIYPGYRTFETGLNIQAGQAISLPMIQLTLLNAQIDLSSNPVGASVLLDKVYLGQTPLSITLEIGKPHSLSLQKPSYQIHKQELLIEKRHAGTMLIELLPILGQVTVTPTPANSEIWLNGKFKGRGTMTLELPTIEQRLTIKHKGYSDHWVNVTPQLEIVKELQVKLLTLDESKKSRKALSYQNKLGQSFRLIFAGTVTMGSDREEHGFNRDQVRRDVTLKHDYYLGLKEVTNREYQAFRPGHSSGASGRIDLNPDNHPAVQVSWLDAVRYCNWLSEQEKLPPAYVIEQDQARIIPDSDGYRLPTEAEWAGAARRPQPNRALLKLPWGPGSLPRELVGNFGEQRGVLSRILIAYKDGHAGTAPVGSFKANPLGLFDLAGNVSEWANDYYQIHPPALPEGPSAGTYRVIRGSSWLHTRIEELRFAYRGYGNEGSKDVGFRLARTSK